ncbi:MAG TPA: HYR domain-containing protein, partial [Draconibacterium sp.]|nr:HYR domain-containing protein [Draconibacterium sp.]
MTKQTNNLTGKLAIMLLAALSLLMEPTSVKASTMHAFTEGIGASSIGYLSYSVLFSTKTFSGHSAAYDDTNGIVCPENISTYTDLNSCDALITSGLNIQDPNHLITTLTWTMEGATNAQSPSSGVNQLSTFVFNEGTTIVTYLGRTRNNERVFCSFEVIVSDNQAPRLKNPLLNVTTETDENECSAIVKWNNPVFVDNCTPGDQITWECDHTSGSEFPVGITKITYQIHDGIDFNSNTFQFDVIVVDNEIPFFKAPERASVVFGQAVPEAFTNLAEFLSAGGQVSDNCEINASSFHFVREIRTGTESPFTVTRTYRIADEHGNIAETDHHILVEKAEVSLKSSQIDLTASSGNWSNTAIWGGTLPNSGDNVTIPSGVTVTVDITTAVCNNITIESGGTLIISGSNILSVYGDWNNSGTFTPGTNGTVVFTGTNGATISGTTAFENLTVSKGSISTPVNIAGSVTVLSGGLLTMNSGLITIGSGASLALTYSSGLTIPSSAGLEVNGGTLTTGNFSITNNGLIRVNSGNVTFGVNSGNTVHTQNHGAFIVSNGTVDIAGRLESSADGTLSPPGVNSGITISGGTVTLATAGNNLSNTGSLNVLSSGDFYFTGGTIVFENPSTATTSLDLGIIGGSGTKTLSGGTFQFGNTNTATNSVFILDSDIPLSNVTSSVNADLLLNSNLVVTGSLSLDPNSSIDLNGFALQQEVAGTGTYTFPIDDGNGNSISVVIDINSVSSYGSNPYIEVTSTDGKFSPQNASNTNYLSRYWSVIFNDINSPNYNVTASYPIIDVSGTESEIAAGVWNGSFWTKDGVASSGSISASNVSETSIWFTGITLENPSVEINGGAANEEICYGSSVLLATTTNGDAQFSYLWSSVPAGYSSTSTNITVSPIVNTTYTVVVTDANGFTATDSIQVVVNPIPDVVATPSSATVCSGSSPNISLSGSVSGTTYNWSVSQSGVSGASAGSGNSINQTLSATGSTPGTATYTITPSANGCTGTSITVVITVNPTPDVVATPASEIICSGTSTNINLSGSVSGTTYSWTVSQSGVSGASTGSGN